MAKFIGVTMLTVVLSAFSNANAAVEFKPDIFKANASGKIEYTFDLFDSTSSKSLSDKELSETHTQLLHLIAYDPSLNVFIHVHPIFNGTKWSVDMDLDTNGDYFVWLQGKTKKGNAFDLMKRLLIENGEPELPLLPLGDNRIGADGITRVELAKTKIKAGKSVSIGFTVSRTDGSQPDLSPYLGEFAHVIATPAAGDLLLHVHPMEGSQPHSGELHVKFPAEGEYRLWVQLVDGGSLKTIPLSLTVNK